MGKIIFFAGALNDKMHVTRCLEGEYDDESSSTSEGQPAVDIAKFGKLYSAILLTNGEVVSMPLLNQKGIFRWYCDGISGKPLMIKVQLIFFCDEIFQQIALL